ncbi:MAG: hypothetical protein IJR44_06165, partial [Neisseriaceae bacterium]|nr:hypothetical protein [Neisseriaceae bacterium]
MSDKFQFIQDAINHSLAFENETNRETVERDTEDYIQNEIDTPTSWHWKKEDIANKMKTLQQEQYTALYSFKEDGYNEWLAEYQFLIDVDESELSNNAQVHFFEIEDILQRIDDRIDKVFDGGEKVYKSDKTELREDLERLTIQTDLLYKTNNNEDWKDAFREALDKVSLFETFVPLDEVFDTKKRMAILADLSDRLDAGDLHTFVEEIEYHQDVIDFSEIHEILDEMRSNLSVSDVFHAHSDREILDLVRHNDNFWEWFETDENNEESLSYRLSMVENGLPRLFYRGLRDVADEEEIEVGNYEEASYNADYFSSNPKVAGTYINFDQDEYDNTSKIFSGFLRPAENPFVLPCDVHFVHDGWGKPSTANWNNLLEHYNIYEAMCLFEMAGLDNEILKANWDDAFGGMRVTDVETYAYTDAERNDDDEWNKPVKTFVFYKREHSGSLKAYEFIVNEHYTPDDFRGKDGRMPSFVQETELLVSTNDMKTNIQAQGKHDRVYFLNCVDVGGGGISGSLNRSESRSIIVAAWHFDPTSYGQSYFKEVRNKGDFDVRDNRIFYSLFDIEQDSKQEMETKENQNPTVIASEPSERGNLHTTENGRLNQEIATPATQVRNDGLSYGLNSGSLNVSPEQEFSATAERLGGEDAYKQAKESGKTALTYKQWVQVRTPSFKAWFGDWENDPENASKVINPKTGEPLVVYHGARENAGFTEFDTNGHGKTADTGAFFSDDYMVAATYAGTRDFVDLSPENFETDEWGDEEYLGDYEGIYPVFLNIRTPDEFDFDGRNWNEFGAVWNVSTDEDGIIESFYTEEEARNFAESYEEENDVITEVYYDRNEYLDTTDTLARDTRKYS